jgi:hypothetical protein
VPDDLSINLRVGPDLRHAAGQTVNRKNTEMGSEPNVRSNRTEPNSNCNYGRTQPSSSIRSNRTEPYPNFKRRVRFPSLKNIGGSHRGRCACQPGSGALHNRTAARHTWPDLRRNLIPPNRNIPYLYAYTQIHLLLIKICRKGDCRRGYPSPNYSTYTQYLEAERKSVLLNTDLFHVKAALLDF